MVNCHVRRGLEQDGGDLSCPVCHQVFAKHDQLAFHYETAHAVCHPRLTTVQSFLVPNVSKLFEEIVTSKNTHVQPPFYFPDFNKLMPRTRCQIQIRLLSPRFHHVGIYILTDLEVVAVRQNPRRRLVGGWRYLIQQTPPWPLRGGQHCMDP